MCVSHCGRNEVSNRAENHTHPGCDSLFLLSIQQSNIRLSGISDSNGFWEFHDVSWKFFQTDPLQRKNILKKQWECFQIFCKYSDATLDPVHNYFSTDRTCDTLKFWCTMWKKHAFTVLIKKPDNFLVAVLIQYFFARGLPYYSRYAWLHLSFPLSQSSKFVILIKKYKPLTKAMLVIEPRTSYFKVWCSTR